MSILCMLCYIILRIGGDFAATGQIKVQASTQALHSLSLTRGHAELLLSLLANTTVQYLLDEFCSS